MPAIANTAVQPLLKHWLPAAMLPGCLMTDCRLLLNKNRFTSGFILLIANFPELPNKLLNTFLKNDISTLNHLLLNSTVMKNLTIIKLLMLCLSWLCISCSEEKEDNWAETLLLDNHGKTKIEKVYKNVIFVSDTFIPFRCTVFTF